VGWIWSERSELVRPFAPADHPSNVICLREYAALRERRQRDRDAAVDRIIEATEREIQARYGRLALHLACSPTE